MKQETQAVGNRCKQFFIIFYLLIAIMRIKYLLDPQVLQRICTESLDEYNNKINKKVSNSVGETSKSGATEVVETIDKNLVDILLNNLTTEYPFLYKGTNGKTRKLKWVVSTAAGATGWLTLLFTSLREYLILFGCANITDGHSGRYRSDVYDTILTGEMIASQNDDPTICHVYKPGATSWLKKGEIKSYSITKGTWMLEYSRGNIVSMLPTGLMDNLSSNLDFKSFFWTVKEYFGLMRYKREEKRVFKRNLKTQHKLEKQKIKKNQQSKKEVPS